LTHPLPSHGVSLVIRLKTRPTVGAFFQDLQLRTPSWNLPAYDAAYLDLAIRMNIPLATTDDELKKIAIAEGIQVFS
jgi:predicted nucleic acid-binding protein